MGGSLECDRLVNATPFVRVLIRVLKMAELVAVLA